MARNRGIVIALALAAPLACLVPVVATGDGPVRPKPARPAVDGGDRYDPENVVAISQAMETLVKGNEKFAAGDFAAAIDIYRRALQLNPRLSLGYYLLGEAYLAGGNVSEAEASFKQADEVRDPKALALHARILFVIADVLERQKKWPEAKEAWTRYADLAAKLGRDGGAFPESATSRLAAIEKVTALEAAYVKVRERIVAERDAGSKPDAGGKKR